MSSRQMRRLREQLEAAKKKNEEPCSDDDFEPLYMNNYKKSYNLPTSEIAEGQGLEPNTLSKMSDTFSLLRVDSLQLDASVDEEVLNNEVLSDEAPCPTIVKKKNKNNNKKKKKNKRREQQAITSSDGDLNEVDRALAEVNSILGEPEPPQASAVPKNDARAALLRVNHKFLSAQDEFTRRFGPDEEEKRNQRPNVFRQLKRQIMLPQEKYKFSVCGLTMEKMGEENGEKYFQLVHSVRYQMGVRGLVGTLEHRLASIGPREYDMYANICLEHAVQNVDLYFMLDEASVACKLLEGAINFLQNIFCPSFNYCDGLSRLDYVTVENRTFHIILLKYLHLVTNKACHRTALEICKLMLSLDPTDPLAVIFIMDTLALRAREHQWLVDIYAVWEKERDAGRLFHMLYSHALAKYQLYMKSKKQEDLESAEYHIKDAMQKYPNVAVMLLAHCNQKCPEIVNHELFTALTESTTSASLKELQQFYVAFCGPKWREDNIPKWLAANAVKLSKAYDTDAQTRTDCSAEARRRHVLFKECPIQIDRHLFVIRSMSNLLVDGAVPHRKDTFSFNPYPHVGRSMDVNQYFEKPLMQLMDRNTRRSFMESLVPDAPPADNNG